MDWKEVASEISSPEGLLDAEDAELLFRDSESIERIEFDTDNPRDIREITGMSAKGILLDIRVRPEAARSIPRIESFINEADCRTRIISHIKTERDSQGRGFHVVAFVCK